jgi:serine/threonine protein kinase/Tol biopolymer transport system component
MTLSVAQMALMSRLLDEALPLDAAARRDWLDKLSPEYRELAQYLREALLPADSQAADLKSLSTLPKLGAADHGGAGAASGLQPGARVGPYELIRLLGAGGMAEVWLARRADGAFNREVALKLPMLTQLRADLEQRFARERDILASLEHPFIARFYDAGIDRNGLPYLAMEYVRGQPLTSRCDAHRLGIPERLELILQVLEAVQYAHERQVIHRDLKPSNILVTESGQVRLLDFGVSKLLGAADEQQLTQLTSMYGRALTPDYASPEMLHGDTVDARSDIYSVGVLLYEMLTGVRPYRLKSAASIGMLEHAIASIDLKNPSTQCEPEASAARNCTPEKLTRQLQGDLDAVVIKALAKEPAERYQSADALADDLRRCLHHEPIRGRTATPGYRLRTFISRHRRLAALGAATAVMLMAGALAWFAAARGYFWRNPLADAKFTRLLDFPGTERAAAISADGKFVTFLGNRDGQIDIWVSEVGSGTYRNLTNGDAGELAPPSEIRALGFSVDSSLVTVWTRRADGSRAGDVNILAVPRAGGPLQPYLREAGEFDWSRDGKRLVYHTTAPGDPYFLRESEELGNRGDRRIYVAEAGVHSHFPVWSPDNAYIYFVRGAPPGDWDIWRIQPSGAGLERLTFQHTRVTFPVMLDRRTLLYLATDWDGSGPWMYALDVERRVPHRISSGLESYTSLAASADGTRLVATIASARTSVWRIALTDDPGAATAAGGPSLVSANAATPRLGADFVLYVSWRGHRQGIWSLTHGTTREIWGSSGSHIVGGPAIARDGRRIAFSVAEGDKTLLYVMDQDGARVRVLSDAFALRGNPAWAPDGQSIVTAVLRDGVPRLTRIFLNGDSPLPLVSEYSVDPVWSPDGRFLVYSGADVGTTFPLRAAAADGRPYPLPSVILSRGARVAFFRDPQTLVILGGEIGHQNPSLLDLRSGVQRVLAELPADFVVRDFDISAAGSEIVFDRLEVNTDLALIERPR